MWELFKVKLENYNKIKSEAEEYSNLRMDCKNFLKKHNLDFDKFTIVKHDSEIGYIAEKFITNYLKKHTKYEIMQWSDNFDLYKIKSILKSKNVEQNDINLIKEFFYDKYDVKICDGRNQLYIDVKTAKTKKIPDINWNFLYPVIQSNKSKDYCIILVYLVYNDSDILDKMYLIGTIDYNELVCSNIQPKGTKTIFGTISQTDNYITQLKKYKNIHQFIERYFDYLEDSKGSK